MHHIKLPHHTPLLYLYHTLGYILISKQSLVKDPRSLDHQTNDTRVQNDVPPFTKDQNAESWLFSLNGVTRLPHVLKSSELPLFLAQTFQTPDLEGLFYDFAVGSICSWCLWIWLFQVPSGYNLLLWLGQNILNVQHLHPERQAQETRQLNT